MPGRTSKNSRRATHACLNCRYRKVRCDVSRSKPPCSNCRWDNVACNVVPRSTARRLDMTGATTTEHAWHETASPTRKRWSLDSQLEQPASPHRPQESPSTAFDAVETSINQDEIHTSSQGRDAWTKVIVSSTWDPAGEAEDLVAQGCFHVPITPILSDFLQKYFLHVHPMLPLLDESEFLRLNDLDAASPLADYKEGELLLLLLQAVMFACSSYMEEHLLARLGFDSPREARASFYKKAKLLYENSQIQDDLLMSQTALLLTYWCPAFAPFQEKPNSTWLSIAIKHARAIGSEESFAAKVSESVSYDDGGTSVSRVALKRLWWCCIIRDRIMALCVRRPIQIRSTILDCTSNTSTGLGYIAGIFGTFRMYDASAGRVILRLTGLLCKLCIHATKALDLVYQKDGDSNLASTENARLLTSSALEAAESELSSWCEVAQGEIASQQHHLGDASERGKQMILLYMNLLWIYYESTRLALYNFILCQTAFKTRSSALRARNMSCTSFPEKYKEIMSCVDHTVSRVENILRLNTRKVLPSSIVGCTALPLALHFLAINGHRKSQIDFESTIYGRKEIGSLESLGRLQTLLKVMEICRPMYDGVHWVSKTIQYLMECTHFDDEILEVSLEECIAEDSEEGDCGFEDKHLRSILNHPSYYLRMALTIDISIREGRLPEEADFPDAIKTLICRTGCFMPTLFDDDDETDGQNESYDFLRGVDQSLVCSTTAAQDDCLLRFIEQDRSLFFAATELGLGP